MSIFDHLTDNDVLAIHAHVIETQGHIARSIANWRHIADVMKIPRDDPILDMLEEASRELTETLNIVEQKDGLFRDR